LMSIRRGNGNLGRTRHKPSVRRDKRPRDREIGTLRPMETKSRATLIESLDLRRVALGPWGSLVYPWWFGTTRLRFKSGRTHSSGVSAIVHRFDPKRTVAMNRGMRRTVRRIGGTSTLSGVDGNAAHHAPASIGDGPERHGPRSEEEHEESRRASAGEVVAVRRPIVDIGEGMRRVILIEQRDPRRGEYGDIEYARGEPGILYQNGDVRRGRDVVKRPGHGNRRQQVLIGEGSGRHGPDAHRHESEGRKAMEAVDPLNQGSLPQDLPPPE